MSTEAKEDGAAQDTGGQQLEAEPASSRHRQLFAAGRRWRGVARRLGEIAIVTAGILIAFALDAWWDSRATAEQEQVHLRALVSDLQLNVALLTTQIQLEARVASSCQDLLRLARTERADATPSLGRLVTQVFNSSRYEPVMGAYEALVNSGGLTLIRDEALRGALAGFAAKVRGQYAESWSNEHYFAFVRDFGGRVVLLIAQDASENTREREFQQMLRDPKFQEHLAMRFYSERDIAGKYSELLRQAEELLVQLRAQVRETG